MYGDIIFEFPSGEIETFSAVMIKKERWSECIKHDFEVVAEELIKKKVIETRHVRNMCRYDIAAMYIWIKGERKAKVTFTHKIGQRDKEKDCEMNIDLNKIEKNAYLRFSLTRQKVLAEKQLLLF